MRKKPLCGGTLSCTVLGQVKIQDIRCPKGHCALTEENGQSAPRIYFRRLTDTRKGIAADSQQKTA